GLRWGQGDPQSLANVSPVSAKERRPSLIGGYCLPSRRRLPCAGPCRARAALRAGKRRAAPARDFGPAATRLGRAARVGGFAAALAPAGRLPAARAGAPCLTVERRRRSSSFMAVPSSAGDFTVRTPAASN